MPVRDDADLARVALEAGELLQSIHDYCPRERNAIIAKVRFPRGFILPAETYRRSFSFVQDAHTRSNLAYASMTLDVLRWLAVRTDLNGLALEMVIKEAICVVASICECLTVRRGVHGLGRNSSFARRTARLVEIGAIDGDTKADLDWAWQVRCGEHLMDLDHAEYRRYARSDYNRALRAYGDLRDAMATRYG